MRCNSVFIATSIDGYISDKNGGLEWLNAIDNPEQVDMGYNSFISQIDALVMGRNTFQTVLGFDIDWPYQVPVFVLSTANIDIPVDLRDKVEVLSGKPAEIVSLLHTQGYNKLYIDGGVTIQKFLEDDLIDEVTITIIPVLLGGGAKLFSELSRQINFELIESKVFLNQVVQNKYRRKPLD